MLSVDFRASTGGRTAAAPSADQHAYMNGRMRSAKPAGCAVITRFMTTVSVPYAGQPAAMTSAKGSVSSAGRSVVMQITIRSRSSVLSADSRFRTASSMENAHAAPFRCFTTTFCLRNSTRNASTPERFKSRPISKSCTIRVTKRLRRTSMSIFLTDIPGRKSTMCWC